MKAFICTQYGSPEVLQKTEIKTPEPKDNEVLIKIHATTVNAADARIRGAVFPSIFNIPVRLALGFKGPRKKVLGVELAGEIVSAGEKISKFKPGDQVFASTGSKFGTYAEYICLTEKDVMSLKPKNMSYEEAAAVPHCALAALYYLQKAKIKKGDKVLIFGASGGIGTFAVQIANIMGAEVSGVCSTNNIEMVKSIGAKQVVDYTQQNIATIEDRFDLIFDTIGKCSIKEGSSVLKENGQLFSAVHLELHRIFDGIKVNIKTKKKVIGGVATYTIENLNILKELIESEKLKTVIDKRYEFDQIPEAHTYVDKEHKKGHVVIAI